MKNMSFDESGGPAAGWGKTFFGWMSVRRRLLSEYIHRYCTVIRSQLKHLFSAESQGGGILRAPTRAGRRIL